MAVYAVGDIQGCYDPLRRLLEQLAFDPVNDRLWCTGDMVNRGPDSLSVLRFLKELGEACHCVLGNHDLHLLGQAAGEAAYRRDSLIDVLEAPDADDLVEWLRHLPLLHDDESIGWCMVHAGLHPAWTLKKARKRAARIEKKLQGKKWQDFCRSLHHQQFSRSEPKDDKHARRLFSVAVLTRARFCTAAGRFNWDSRANDPASSREKPWFAHRDLAWRGERKIVYGHWAARGLVQDQPHVLGLDTGCVWGGQLTAARLDASEVMITQVASEAYQKY